MNLANAGAALLGAIVRSYDGTANENQPPGFIKLKRTQNWHLETLLSRRALVSALLGFTDRVIL